MLNITECIKTQDSPEAQLTLPYELRQKSRLRAHLDDGREASLTLPRGTILRHGDLLRSEDGLIIVVQATLEKVSTATTSDPLLFARACYHLGNRHVKMQISETWLRYLHDHVLDDMVRSLNLDIKHESAPFEPEGGAYGNASLHSHSHGHSH